MAFSQGIRFTISADSTKIRSEFGKVEQMAQATGQKIDQALKAQNAAVQSLANTRVRNEYAQANTIGKIRVVTQQLRTDAQAMAKMEQGSVTWLKAKERIESNLVHLRGLQLKAQKEQVALMKSPVTSAAGGGAPPAEGPNAGGLAALGSGLFKRVTWLGAGALFSGLLNSFRGFFQGRAEVAGAQAEATGAGLASTRQRFARMGGLQGQLRQGTASLKDLERDRVEAQKLVDSLQEGIMMKGLSLLHPETRQQLIEAEKKVESIKGKIQEQHDTNALTKRDLDRETALYHTELITIQNINRARLHGSASQKRILLEQEAEARNKVEIEKAFGTPEGVFSANKHLESVRGELQGARQQILQRSLDVPQEFAGQVAQGRSFRNGRQRPRSELERVADRAAQFRERARALAITDPRGTGTGQGINFLVRGAQRSEQQIADRLSQATEGAPKVQAGDDSTIKPELIHANQLLTGILKALQEVDIQ